MTLYEYCLGFGEDVDRWREWCEDSKRMAQQATCGVSNMEPPPIIVFECEYRVD